MCNEFEDEDVDGYDWNEDNLVPGICDHNDNVIAWIPKEMYFALLELEERRYTLSHEQFGDEIAKIMRFPRQMLDQVAAMTPELRERARNGEIDFDEAVRRSRQ